MSIDLRSKTTPATPSRRITWFTLLGLLLVPVTIAGLLLAGLWNPTSDLTTVTAAIVNNDQPVEIDGQTVPLGRQLAAALAEPDSTTGAGSTTYAWVVTDAADAAAGLDSGAYAAVVTIPEGFSAAATSSTSTDATPVQATIDVATSEQAGLLDPAITSALTGQAKRVLGAQITTTYLENVFLGFGTMRTALTQISDGAAALDTGTADLAQGASSVADGATSLASGTEQLSSGSAKLATGADEAESGAGELATGTNDLSSGLATLSSGADEVASGAGSLAGGAADLADGANQVADGANQVADGAGELATNAAKVAGATAAAGTAAAQSYDGILSLAGDLQAVGAAYAQCQVDPVGCQADLAEALAGLPDQSELTALVTAAGTADAYLNGSGDQQGLVAGTEQLATGADQLAGAADQVATGAGQVATGAEELAGGADQLASGADDLAGGTSKAATGSATLADGADQLASGMSTLASGSSDLADGAAEANQGADQLAEGADAVATGAAQTNDGAAALADGIDQLTSNVPTYTEEQSKALADVLATPVAADDSGSGPIGAPGAALFAALALWIGSLATYLLLSPIPPHALESSRSSVRLALRAYLPGLLLGLLQGLAVGVLMLATVLETSTVGAVGFLAFCLVVGASFAAVQLGLAALLGTFGRFLAMTAAVGVFVVGVTSSAPAWLATVAGASPMGPAITGLRLLAGTGGFPSGPTLVLAAWLVLGVLLAVAGVARHRHAATPPGASELLSEAPAPVPVG